jgi:transcriptional regulator with XRE-family HTH domain
MTTQNKTEFTVTKPLDLHGIVINIRKDSKMTQMSVAEKLGIKAGSYSEYEKNLLQGSLSRFLKLLNALDVELVIRKKN